MMRHVLRLGRPSYSGCGRVDRGNDLSLTGPGASGQEPEGSAGVHGAVSVGCAAVSDRGMDGHRNSAHHRSDALDTARPQGDGTGLVAWDRDGEADSGESLAIPDVAARFGIWTQDQSGQRDSGIAANDRGAACLQNSTLAASSLAARRAGSCGCGISAGTVIDP